VRELFSPQHCLEALLQEVTSIAVIPHAGARDWIVDGAQARAEPIVARLVQ
jgi:hypothetical protein